MHLLVITHAGSSGGVCVLFMQTDLEYGWAVPKYKLRYGLLRLLGFGAALNRREAEEMSVGDRSVWSFLTAADYSNALRPRRRIDSGE